MRLNPPVRSLLNRDRMRILNHVYLTVILNERSWLSFWSEFCVVISQSLRRLILSNSHRGNLGTDKIELLAASLAICPATIVYNESAKAVKAYSKSQKWTLCSLSCWV